MCSFGSFIFTQPASWPTLVRCLWVFKNQCLREPRALILPSQPETPGLPLDVGLCPERQVRTKSSVLPTASAELPTGDSLEAGQTHDRGSPPASAQTPGKGSDPWLPRHLRKSAGHWKQTKNPGTSQMRSRWLSGTRFPNIPSSPFTLSPIWFPFEGV